jgi:8-amino-7-oxononanoate synthase
VNLSLILKEYTDNLGILKRILPKKKFDLCRDFSTNDYLALSINKLCIAGSIEYVKRYGVGSTGSRLLSGNMKIIEDFESKIASSTGFEKALVWSSGFSANYSILNAIFNSKLKQNWTIFCHKNNHNSIYKGLFSNTNNSIVRFTNFETLEEKIISNMSANIAVVIESLFSMDGNISPINEVAKLCDKYNAMLYIDDAHGVGVIDSYGAASILEDKFKKNTIIVGTFSKCFGSIGGYALLSEVVYNYIITACDGFIYTTAPPPQLIGAWNAAWDIIKDNNLRDILYSKVRIFRNELGTDIGTKDDISPIIIIKQKSSEMALENQRIIEGLGFKMVAIQPPTASPRIRISITTHHTDDIILEATRLWREYASS